MSLYGMMRTSASGMAAQANMLGTVSDNIANSSTTGYKRASEEFSTLVLESGVAEYASGAVESHTRRDIDAQGAFNYTSSTTDLAIRGQGFFVVSSPDGTTSLTRAGSFVQDGSGKLVNAAGYQLMAYASSAGITPVSNGLSGLVPVDITTMSLVAQPSTSGKLSVNLPPTGTLVAAADLPSANAATSTFTKMTSMVAYDNIGAATTLDIFESRTAANTWEITVFDRSAQAVGGGFPYSSGPLVTTALTFDPANGSLAVASPTSIAVPVPNGSTLTLDLSGCTELAAEYLVRTATVDGSAPSAVDHIEISDTGELSAIYKNGSRLVAYQIPLATVTSPDNLEVRSGNLFSTTADSGSVLVGLPQTGSLGGIVSGALEKSTVDVATELTTMIESQHSYTANSKVFQTAADLMDVLINLKR
jgi:flagellar hook protein FlgE